MALQELAKVYVADALRRWEPRVVVTSLAVKLLEDGEGNGLSLRLRYSVIQRNVRGNQVLLEGVEQEVVV